MKANNKFVQVKVGADKSKKQGFQAFDTDNPEIVEGIVESVGDEVKGISKGDKVVIYKVKSLEYTKDGIKYFFTKFEEILAVDSKKK